jgi:16S rRNA (cytosine967-C5)-methyltransferase
MGVLQKNPDAKWRRKPDDFERYCKRQLALLRSASIHLKPGGRLVYSVCSFEPEETSAVVDKFLVECVDFTIDTSAVPILEGVRPPILSNGYLTTYPHRHGMDGFFAVMLRRR